MINFNKEALIKILLEEEGYSEYGIDFDIELICHVDEKLEEALNTWICDRQIVDFQVEGVTLKMIMEKQRLNFINALLLMGVFIRQPEMAKEFLTTPVFFIGKLGKKAAEDEYPWSS